MKRDSDVVLGLIDANWREIHHIEDQRSRLTNMLLVIESAAVALVIEKDYAPGTLPLCALLCLLAGIGLVSTRKFHERFRFAQKRLTQCYRTADALFPDARLLEGLREANAKHRADERSKVGALHLERVPLNRVWSWVHGTFLAAGLFLGAAVLGTFVG